MARRAGFRSVRMKILLPVVLMGIMICGAVTFRIFQKTQGYLYEINQSRAEIIASGLRELHGALGQGAALNEALQRQSEGQLIADLAVVDDEGRVVSASREAWIGSSTADVLALAEKQGESLVYAYEMEGYRGAKLIVFLEGAPGWEKVMASTRMVASTIVAGILGMLFVIALTARRYMSMPIGRMIEAIHARRQGSDCIDLSGYANDELGEVAETLRALFEREDGDLRKLAESEHRLDLALQGSKDGIWDWPDVRADQQYWSPRMRELLGLQESSVKSLASYWAEMAHPCDLPELNSAVKRAKRDDTALRVSVRLRVGDGDYRWFQVRGQGVDDQGRRRMSGAITDVHVETVIREELGQRNRSIQDFASIVSHDLKQPLRGMSHSVQIVLDEQSSELSELARERLERVVQMAVWVNSLLDSLLKFSRLEQSERSPQVCDLKPHLDAVIQALEPLIGERGVELQVPEEIPLAYCHPELIARVFDNLITNSIKYNVSERVFIELTVEELPDSGQLLFRVRDNGIGIEPQHRERVFQIFKRLHGKGEHGGGTGAGLALVSRIVAREGGRIWVEPNDGPGSCFCFTLPLAPSVRHA